MYVVGQSTGVDLCFEFQQVFDEQLDDPGIEVGPGTCITIPFGTAFQFRATGTESLSAVACTMPPWPGDGEAVRTRGPWEATVTEGPGLGEGD